MRFSTNAATTPSRVALAAGLLFLGCFQMETWEVRFGNIDDVDYFTVFRSGTLLSYIDATARSEGRFFQFWFQGFTELLNHIRSNFWFGLHRTVLVGGEFALGAWLLARLSGDNRLGWLFWVLGLGTLQIPPGFYPLLSYPPIGFGFIALLTAALAYDHALVDDQPRLRYAAAACFVASLLLHDIFVTFAPLFPLILLARRPRCFRENLSTLTPLAAGFAAYLVIYFGYRRLTAAEHTYEGTAFSFDLAAWVMTWLRYTLSVAPGFELWFLRDLSPPAPLLREWTSAAEFIGRELSFSGVAKAALLVVSVVWLIRPPPPSNGPPPDRLSARRSVCPGRARLRADRADAEVSFLGEAPGKCPTSTASSPSTSVGSRRARDCSRSEVRRSNVRCSTGRWERPSSPSSTPPFARKLRIPQCSDISTKNTIARRRKSAKRRDPPVTRSSPLRATRPRSQFSPP